MTNDKTDRDAAVDRLLTETMARRSTAPGSACLDADTLAAWADHAFDGGARAAAEAHAADCARCQAMLAAMVKTAPATSAAVSWWHMPSLRWLVPLTAAAAAAIVWTVVPLREMDRANVRQVSQSAESAQPPAAATAATDAVAPNAPAASSKVRPEPETARQAKEVEADKRAPASPRANALADAPARRGDARLEKPQAAAESAPPVATLSATKAFSPGAPETVIVSSNPASRWRIVPGGAVQRTMDGGSTWQTQSTGVNETLSAGSSPSPSVCWLVGPGGIVLLATDGSTWKRVTFPEPVQLVAVRATDDQTATVTTADGREFTTADGGRTWARPPGI